MSQGLKAIVSGSTAGIGKATAIELSKNGVSITLLARNKVKLEEVISELDHAQGQLHDYLIADFTDQDQFDLVCSEIQKRNYNILVNNTGGPAGGPIAEANPEEFFNAFNQHLIANHKLVQAVLIGMKDLEFGRIINVISTSVKAPLNGLGVSNTIRGAVANWAKTMANELGKHNITVNNVLPGATNTGRLNQIFKLKSDKTGKSVEEIKKGMESIVPMGRIAEPEEVANAIAFLASSKASYISGINLPVDGGRTPCL